ncbi:MAG: group II intron reverse transcriptase/maturase [Deltaproteobacteria bacterium]|nr:group II intron reverse transcriptase/maturase [Deltaproteobacteria bacterium]
MQKCDRVLSEWTSIDWKKVERKVTNLKRRIFKATERGDLKQVANLQKLASRSFAVKVLAIKRATQINNGRKTAGVDGKIIDDHAGRVKIANEEIDLNSYNPPPVNRVYILKKPKKSKRALRRLSRKKLSNEPKRPLGIPTIKDRIIQGIGKTALEPEYEAKFENNSFGFRPGRCAQDAIEETFNALNNGVAGGNEWILDADISKAFDTINHEFILNQLGNFPAKDLISRWLKAGFVEFGEIHETTIGTPQGGVISPLLANIALDGLQKHLGKGYRYARYADDFVIMAKTRQAIEEVKPMVEQWLLERGLKLNDEKTRIIHREEGFNFLGFHIRMYKNGKLIIKPQKEKVKGLLDKIRTWLDENKQVKTEAVIKKLNSILRGWANYYHFVCSKETFSKIQHKVHWILWRWAKRRHPNKSKYWILNNYYERSGKGSLMVFKKLYRIDKIPIVRHIKVKGNASPDDPKLLEYWENRGKRLGKDQFARGSTRYLLARNQNWKCYLCGNWLMNGEEVDTNHIIPVSEGGSDHISNKIIYHESCHYQWHSNREKNKLRAA